MGRLTEECFQQGHLEFFGDKQWIELGEDRIEIEAVRTREGTFPEGSQWTRNPIPNCLWPEVSGPDGDPVIDPLASTYPQDMYPGYYPGYRPPDLSTNICRLVHYYRPNSLQSVWKLFHRHSFDGTESNLYCFGGQKDGSRDQHF